MAVPAPFGTIVENGIQIGSAGSILTRFYRKDVVTIAPALQATLTMTDVVTSAFGDLKAEISGTNADVIIALGRSGPSDGATAIAGWWWTTGIAKPILSITARYVNPTVGNSTPETPMNTQPVLLGVFT